MTVSKQLAVVGDPVSHSLSPLIHNRWIAEAGLDAHYSAVRLQAVDAAPDLREMRKAFFGLNITLPHKIAALKAATKSSPEAQAIGAANTLAREAAGGWHAHNTDIAGFSDAFAHALGTRVHGSHVVLIGAGGAARAVAFHLSSMGVKFSIVNRTRANAETLARELAPNATVAGLDDLRNLAAAADILINSASLGHSGQTLPDLPAGKGRPFLDLSYGKAARLALDPAQAAGWKPHDGLRMLVGQAAAAFRIWFGISPDFDGALGACQAAVAART
ncbi:MAG TPA: NAD(P)-dependent oxidoreductase [Hyphomonadaceae bacterium]|nr:NAD(P)-dependent oxidoreductase [Hyphomonadaceae bacterium]